MAGLLQLRHFHQGLGDSPHVLAQQENAGGVRQLGQHDAQNTVEQIQLGDRDVVGDHGDGKGNKNGADEQEVQHGLSPEGGKDKGIRRKNTGEQLAGVFRVICTIGSCRAMSR